MTQNAHSKITENSLSRDSDEAKDFFYRSTYTYVDIPIEVPDGTVNDLSYDGSTNDTFTDVTMPKISSTTDENMKNTFIKQMWPTSENSVAAKKNDVHANATPNENCTIYNGQEKSITSRHNNKGTTKRETQNTLNETKHKHLEVIPHGSTENITKGKANAAPQGNTATVQQGNTNVLPRGSKPINLDINSPDYAGAIPHENTGFISHGNTDTISLGYIDAIPNGSLDTNSHGHIHKIPQRNTSKILQKNTCTNSHKNGDRITYLIPNECTCHANFLLANNSTNNNQPVARQNGSGLSFI